MTGNTSRPPQVTRPEPRRIPFQKLVKFGPRPAAPSVRSVIGLGVLLLFRIISYLMCWVPLAPALGGKERVVSEFIRHVRLECKQKGHF